jgi:hypothetical protein
VMQKYAIMLEYVKICELVILMQKLSKEKETTAE